MLSRIVTVVGTAVVASLSMGAGAAHAQLQSAQDRGPHGVVWYKPMPAIVPAGSTVYGLYPGIDFHLTTGACRDCASTPKQALWYFREDWVAVPSPGVSVMDFTPGISAQDDVRQWYAAASLEQRTARPSMLWIGSTHFARNVTLTGDDRLVFTDKRSVAFKTVDKIKSNRSYYDDSSKAYFQQRPLRLRGELKGGEFTARAIWPQDWAIDEKAMNLAPLGANESLMDLVRKNTNAKDERFEPRLLWEKSPPQGGARDWSGRAVIGLVLNGAQGDDDEAHGGHFAIATGRHAKGGDWSEWMVNNFYNLDAVSEKGIIAAMLPMDNYLADLNSGQQWYRPSYMLVAVLKNDRAAYAFQGAIARVYNRFYRHDFTYSHTRTNCVGISMDTLRTLGWNIPLMGPTSKTKAVGAYVLKTLEDQSFASGRQAYEYLSEEQTRLYPAAAFAASGRDLLRMTSGAPASGDDARALENLLREDLEALVFVRIPQLPSSRAFGSYPVSTYDEYMKRVPADKSQWNVVPVDARPFPREMMPLDGYRAPPPPMVDRPALLVGAVLAGLAALLGGVIWLWTRRRSRRQQSAE